MSLSATAIASSMPSATSEVPTVTSMPSTTMRICQTPMSEPSTGEKA